MKKVIILGASGSLAPAVINAIRILNDVDMTLFVRNKNRLNNEFSYKYHVIEGDATNYQDVENAVNGQDIVYVNLAGDLELMTHNIVNAMQYKSVKRIIAISSIGIYNEPLRSVLVPYRQLADIIENSNLDYTILRPDWFTDVDEIDYKLTQKGESETGSAISRKSIAAFVASLIENPLLHLHENVGISKPN